jgi:hypothetical protein
MSLIDDKIAAAEFKHYLRDHWGSYLLAAGYTDLTLIPEEVLQLGGLIMHRVGPAVRALNLPNYGHEDYIAFIEAMTTEEKAALRASIDFQQPQYDPKRGPMLQP